GEIGQTQFLPSSYIKYGVDYDGNGHIDLRHSVPDVLASTANLLKTNGWRAGAPFAAGTPNFEGGMREWNHSEVYRKTIVLMAQRLGGGGPDGAVEEMIGGSCTVPMPHRTDVSRRTLDRVRSGHCGASVGCPLYPESGHCRGRAPCPLCAKSRHHWFALFDHLVGEREQVRRPRETERFHALD